MQSEESIESVKNITEKFEKARREFFQKVERVVKTHGRSNKLMQDSADQAALEYSKIFGRLGCHPMLHMKGGKKPPRYIVDRDEVWVLYKPPLWMMGGSEKKWESEVGNLCKSSISLSSAQEKMIETERAECIQQWHGLTQGTKWIDQDNPPTSWGFVQRLDLETDGPVIIAKTWRAQRFIQVQMREHIFTKGYMCLVHGRLEDRIQVVKTKFAELGSDQATQVMLQYDKDNDPFFEWSESGRWKGRSTRMAETFFKPIAYYHRKEDNSDYSLVYVNILTGITHQVRITMQSVGHPLVSDDRYLPKEQALADLKWCPRNFLCEVRSDWFDMCGPYKDEARRKYTRMSVENPLPKLFQGILETKLTLVEKLDPTADLYSGTQYWALGDELLMKHHPKDNEYRKKVMRWGQRKGIHLDALDRLMLLPKEEIDDVLQTYRPSHEKMEGTWVCPVCMGLNQPDKWDNKNSLVCGVTHECEGTRMVDADSHKLPKGWTNYLEDPTLHLLMKINPKYLDARRRILRFTRPSWDKAPAEVEGSPATRDILVALEAALVLNAKAGGNGLSEAEISEIPGFQDIEFPISDLPDDANVMRARLPGSGSHSQWHYTLKGKERIRHTADYQCKTRGLKNPVVVKTDELPEKMYVSKDEKLQRQKERDREEKIRLAAEMREKNNPKKREERERAEREPAKKKQKTKNWKKLESGSNPGNFYYFDEESGETSIEKPIDFVEKKPDWERKESTSNPGKFYYFNNDSGENRVDRPEGVEILNDIPKSKAKAAPKIEPKEEPESIAWERKESSSKPGHFYYFNPITGSNEIHPPRVQLPWKLVESKTKKGQFYYYNEKTEESSVDPPPSARPANKVPLESRFAANSEARRAAEEKSDKLPSNWEKKESEKYKGKFYYINSKTGETSWTRPSSEWEKKESSSNPGVFYYVNLKTGETTWNKDETN